MASGLALLLSWSVISFLVGYSVYVWLRPSAQPEHMTELVMFLFPITLMGTVIAGWIAVTSLQAGLFVPSRTVLCLSVWV